jgi:hypothetical protein
MLPLVAVVVAYSLVGLAISLVTLMRYVQEQGTLDVLAVLLTIREVLGEALSFIWFLLIFHMWGLLDLRAQLGWQAELPPPLTTAEGQVLFLLLALLSGIYIYLYTEGKLWGAFLLALAGTALLQLAFGLKLIDVYFLLALTALGLVSALGAAWALVSELRSRLGG